MYKHERLQKILELTQSNQFWATKDLAEKLNVSQTTIYRDLKELENFDKISRSYGGIAAIAHGTFIPSEGLEVNQRTTSNLEEKQVIAEQAVQLVKDGDTFFVDSSTTCLKFGEALLKSNKRNLTIITNSPRLILLLSGVQDYHTICTGGAYLHHFDALVGIPGEEFIKNVTAEKFFFSVAGIAEFGCTDTEQAEVKIKQLMISRSRFHILLADHTKFDRFCTYLVIKPAAVSTLVTDELVSQDVLAPFVDSNVSILQAHIVRP
jgi:DeoR/GlpR family transcriptional regulator of sugar metabolism